MPTCSLNFRPATWRQIIEHYTSINVEGRRCIARGNLENHSNLRLSNGPTLESLDTDIQIFETNRMRDQLAKLAAGVLGGFSFYPAQAANVDVPAMAASIGAWFVLNEQSAQDVWSQVTQGDYSECVVRLDVGPVEAGGHDGWVWDLTRTRHLGIHAVSIQFTRAAPQVAEPKGTRKTPFWTRARR